MTDDLSWFTVRSIVAWPVGDAGEQRSYEERITLWRADSFDEAIERAEREAAEYAELIDGEPMGLSHAFALAVEVAPGDGDEVFSLIRDSSRSPETYVDAFFDSGTERQQPLDGPPPS